MEPVGDTCRDAFQAGVSIDQAAAALNVSPSTVRRWVKEGRLPADRVATPQGHVFRVHLPAEGTETPATEASKVGSAAPSTAPVVAPSAERAEAMAAYNAALVAPLVAELAQTRVRMLEQADRIADQAEQIGALRAQLEQARDTIRTLEAHQTHTASNLGAEPGEPTPEPSEPSPEPPPLVTDPPPTVERRPWWRRWWHWAAIATL